MTDMFHDAILREFGEMIGIPSLTFDDHGTCCFVVDEEHELAILRTNDRLVLTLPLRIPERALDMPARHLLSLFPQMTIDTLRGEKPMIGWHPQSSRAVALAPLPRHLASAEQLAAATVEFLEWSVHWRDAIQRIPPISPETSPAAQRNDLAHMLALC